MAEQKILVIQLRQLGDILLTTPCLREIKKENPNARITFLSHSMGKLVLDNCPYVDEHFYYDDSTSLLDQFRLARSLRKRSFDLVIDYMNNPRSAFFCLATGAPNRVSYHSSRSFAYTSTVPKGGPEDYVVRDKFRLLSKAGFTPKEEKLVLTWGEKEMGPVFRLIAEEDDFRDAKIRVVISPTHRRPIRKWDIGNYARLADYLIQKWDASIMWIWGPGEEEEIAKIQKLCKEKTLKSPKTSFRELAALIGNTDLFIGNSNGPSHVAVAADICSLQLHGHTDMRSWSPLTDRHRSIQSSEYGTEGATLNSISESDVRTKLEEFYPYISEYANCRIKDGTRMSWSQTVYPQY